MTNRRNTIQKDLVKNAVYEIKRHVTANEVCEFLKKEYPFATYFRTDGNHLYADNKEILLGLHNDQMDFRSICLPTMLKGIDFENDIPTKWRPFEEDIPDVVLNPLFKNLFTKLFMSGEFSLNKIVFASSSPFFAFVISSIVVFWSSTLFSNNCLISFSKKLLHSYN